MHRAVKKYARVLKHQISTCWSNRHEDASALQNLRVCFLVLEDLNVDFSSCPDIQSNESLPTMNKRIKDVVESMAAQVRRLVTVEEGEAQRSMRHFAWQLGLLGKVFDAVPGCQEPVRKKTSILLKHIPWRCHGTTCMSLKVGMILVQGQGDVQHVTEVVNYLTLLVGREFLEKEFVGKFTAWYSGGLMLETRPKTVVTLVSTLRPCEVGKWT